MSQKQLRKRLAGKLNNKSGFTLAEMLVAVAISAILLGITMVGILQYSKNLKLTEMDNAAKEIFIAAQNHLTTADASGELKRYVKSALDEKDISVESDALGTVISSGNVPSDVPSGISWPSNNEEYYYIEYNPSSGSGASLESSVLQYMLPFGAIDDELRTDGRYIIEYNINTATIYGVFFCEEAADLTYVDVIALNSSSPSGREDSAEGRKIRKNYDSGIIGYYGGAMAGSLLAAETQDLELEVKNDETLEVILRDFDYFNAATDGKTLLQTQITITVTGKDSGNQKTFSLDLSGGENPVKKNTGKELWWSVQTVTSDKGERYLEYTLTLDDITRPGGHFADIFTNMIPGEDIIIKAVSSSSEALATVREKEVITNSLFGSSIYAEDSTTKKQITISAFRHLENMDGQISGLKQKGATYNSGKQVVPYSVSEAVQTKDLDWNARIKYFEERGRSSTSICKQGSKENTEGTVITTENTYFSIMNSALRLYDGGGHKISNVVIRNPGEDKNYGDGNGGLFRYFRISTAAENFEGKDLTLENFDIEATKNVAAFAAEVASSGYEFHLTNMLVKGGTFTSSYYQGNTGGLVGYCGSKAIIKDCAAVVKSVASGGRITPATGYAYAGDAGGLIGEISAAGSLIENCYSAGQTKNGKYASDSPEDYNIRGVDMAGGLIGKINKAGATFRNCYSTCSVYVSMSGAAGVGGAGGFIGGTLNGGNVFENCYATGLVSGSDGQAIGTFGGLMKEKDKFSECSFLKGINVDEDGEEKLKACGATNITIDVYGMSYEELSTGEQKATYPFDQTLTTYPFRTVNVTGLEEGTYAEGVHYGDWQKPEEKVTGTNMIAYRERMEGENAYHWFIYGAELKGGEVTYGKTYDDLVTHKGSHVASAEYGFLAEESKLNDQFTQNGKIKDLVNLSGGEKVEIQGKTYYFYVFKDTEDFEDDAGIMTTPAWYIGNGKKAAAVFQLNPYFAAAISAGNETFDYGNENKPYQVRTEGQLENINEMIEEDVSYNGYSYSQTADINLEEEDFEAIGLEEGFVGSYNGTAVCHEITGFRQLINDDDEYPGLIKKLSGTGSISNISLSDALLEDSSKDTQRGIRVSDKSISEIGTITGQVAGGSIIHCTSQVNIEVSYKDRGDETIKIGGLVGEILSISSTEIESSTYLGEIEVSLEQKDVYVGGVVGRSTVNINGCSAKGSISAEIKEDRNDYDWKVGGFAGLIEDGKVENCNSQMQIETKATKGEVKNYYYVGGFAGNILNGSVSKSWSKGSINNNNPLKARTGGFAGTIQATTDINNSYTAIYIVNRANNPGVFIGHTMGDKDSDWNLRYCHGVTLDKEGALSLLNLDFVRAQGNVNPKYTYCYMYRNLTGGNSATFIRDAQAYKELSTFEGFDPSIWEVVNDAYPTLIENPEPVA